MSKFTFVFLGNGRTGTTSIWSGFRNHSQVSCSIRKERLLQIPPDVFDLEFYIPHNFNTTEDTKVLLDGSPGISRVHLNFFDLMKKNKHTKRVCHLYTVRDDEERIDSYFINLISAYYRHMISAPWWIGRGDEIIYENLLMELEDELNTFKNLENVEKIIGKENMFLVRIDKFNKNMEKIQEFLGLNYEDIRIQQLNKRAEKFNNIKCVRLFNEYKKIIPRELLLDKIKTNKELIYERYKVHE